MPGPKRTRRERTHDWEQIQQWTLWPEQVLYEQSRPMLLFGETAGERAKEIDVPRRTLARKSDEFEQYGMQSLFSSGEQGLAGEDVSVWVYEGNLKVEYQATSLSLYELSIEKDTGEIAKVTNARRLETHFRSPQLDLWQLSDTEWLLALRRLEPVARKKRSQIVPLARQLQLPLFGATG